MVRSAAILTSAEVCEQIDEAAADAGVDVDEHLRNIHCETESEGTMKKFERVVALQGTAQN